MEIWLTMQDGVWCIACQRPGEERILLQPLGTRSESEAESDLRRFVAEVRKRADVMDSNIVQPTERTNKRAVAWKR